MTSEEYKRLSLKEFDRAAEKFDDDDPSVYNMCRKDYPDVLAEAVKEPFSDLLDAGCGTGAMLAMFKTFLLQSLSMPGLLAYVPPP